MQAFTSSGSRSGSSSRIFSAVRPATNKSSTSLTRIRIPRMHGRPPHCFGLTVMRSKRVMRTISRQNHGKVKRTKAIFRDVPEQIEVLNHRGKSLTTKDTKDTKKDL